MSRATEIAEREASEAETDEPGEPDAEPVEPIEPDEEEVEEEEVELVEPSSLTQVENIDKALTAEQKRHAKALAKALGAQFEDFAQCPLCQVDGYAMVYQPGEIGPEQRAAILTVMGENQPPDYKAHPTEHRCRACDGWGEMKNGSRREGQGLSACPECFGTGHSSAPTEAAPVAQPTATIYPWDTTAAEVTPSVNTDRWGRPQSHPDFGLDPSSIVSVAR